MHKWLVKTQSAVFFAFCILFTFQTDFVRSESDASYEITSIDAQLDGNTLQYAIKGKRAPAYTVTERFSPFRVVVDIADAVYSDTVTSSSLELPSNSFSSLSIEDLDSQSPKIKRFIFKLSDSHNYDVIEIANGIQLTFAPASAKPSVSAADTPALSILKDFRINSTPNSTTVSIISNQAIKDYVVDTIGKGKNTPPRMYIDIDNVDINELVREKQIGTSVARIRVAPRGKGARIVFDSAGPRLFKYSVAPTKEGLDVVIDETAMLAAAQKAAVGKNAEPSGDKTLDDLITSSEELLSQDPSELVDKAASKAATLEDDFSFSGYKKQRISVDFYKIDIHNVFRLFREITDLNIIIDEDVSGSLTLALNDVPWDFALDIVLNLMDLKKEEKFNTIVIYPAKKEFIWPTRAEDNLSFEADLEIIEEEALIIEKSSSQTKEILKAKELMAKAQLRENMEDFEDAVFLYDKAHQLWPENGKLSNRLASLYLVNLGMNAKALHYAKMALKNDPNNRNASLYAAISSANMQRPKEANEYFLQSISDSPPLKEALMSYAAFTENNGQNEAALKLLDKFNGFYGENLDTMIAKARILDKMGSTNAATQQYKSILASGFQIRPDLRKYIQGRLATTATN